jgi:hypothetical protein
MCNVSIGLEWNQVHYHCGHLLACCTSPGWFMVMIVEQLVEAMGVRENRSTPMKPAPVPLCPPQIPRDLTRGWNPVRGGRKPANNRLSYCAAKCTSIRKVALIMYVTWTTGQRRSTFVIPRKGAVMGQLVCNLLVINSNRWYVKMRQSRFSINY